MDIDRARIAGKISSPEVIYKLLAGEDVIGL
jgi:hypothetical protein